jgi:hypothetical protein
MGADDKKWQREDLYTGFPGELIGVVARNNCYGIMVCLPIQAWRKVNNEYCMEEERLTPFAVVGCMAIAKHEGLYTIHTCRQDEDKGDLMYWTNRSWGWTPVFNDKHLTPLQACDFIAWEGRRAATDIAISGITPDGHRYRASLKSSL